MLDGIFSAIGESIGGWIVPGLAVIGGGVVAATAIRQGGQVAAHCRRGDWLDGAVSAVGLIGSPVLAASSTVVAIGDAIKDAGEAWREAGGDVVPSPQALALRAEKLQGEADRRLARIAEEAIKADEEAEVEAEVEARRVEVIATARRKAQAARQAAAEAAAAEAEEARAARKAAEAEKARTAADAAPKPGVVCTAWA